VAFVVDLAPCIANSAFAAFASASWQIRDLSLAFAKQAGKGGDCNTMMTDPIADMLTRIRNAVRIEKSQVELPLSKVKKGVADVLKREGYIWDWSEIEAAPSNLLKLELKYGPNGERVIRHIKRVSKPGRRVYSRARDLKPILQGLGISVVSTSRGVVSDREARQRNLGGEVLCEIW
jgi:small subunit ribosomal protein S8